MSKKRTFMAALVVGMLSSAGQPLTAQADGTDKSVPAAPEAKANETTHVSGKSGSSIPTAFLEGELLELKRELAAQHAILEAQQARIAELEEHARIPNADSSTVSSPTVSNRETAATIPGASATSDLLVLQSGGSEPSQKPSPLSLKLGPAVFTPGGWADLTGIFRTTDIGSGTGTSFGSIPYNNMLPQAALSEFRMTAQTSRLSMRVDIPAGDATLVTGYAESDFNGFQPPNAFISTNSSTFRLRLFWADVQHGKWELLGGQSWSLLTPNRFGLSPLPENIFTSYRLDTNYLAGLTYERQAGFRVVYHATDWWSIGASLENPQQYAPSSVVFPGTAGFFAGQFDNGNGATNLNTASTNPAIPNLHPDVIMKTAFDWKLGGRALHVEAAGLIRSFKDFNTLVTPNGTDTVVATSGALNFNVRVSKNFRVVANTFYGEGGGRYIGGLGPDLVVKPNGTLSAVHSGSSVGGFEWQVTPSFLLDGYYSGAYFEKNFGFLPVNSTPAATCDGVSGFSCVGFGFPGSANSSNRAIQEGSVGFTRTLWDSPGKGKLQVISQLSYLARSPWWVAAGTPKNAHAVLEYVDLRYVLP